jgi:glycerol-3-phosphate acyltransferase PlsY
MLEKILLLLVCYLIGSIPTAFLIARRFRGVDIRCVGDGNMGARNTTRMLGVGLGVIVGSLDFLKGVGAMLLVQHFDSPPVFEILAGALTVLGHDFPILVGFRGGQGMAVSLGVLSVIMPMPCLWGLMTFGSAFVATRHFDFSAGMGLALMVGLAIYSDCSLAYILFAAGLFISIALKKWLDLPRRRAIVMDVPVIDGNHSFEEQGSKNGVNPTPLSK